jgi:osmotically-inducible protein OsmY
MKKTIALTFTLLLTIAVASTQASLASQEGEMAKKKSDKPAKAAAAPKTDAEIQKCISDKFAASKTITNGAVVVANGEATLTGEAKSAGAKGGATRSAKACGAQKVVNNITAPPPKPKAAATGAKTADKK